MGDNYDPITLHKYLYANASPSNYIDPSGNMSMLSLTMGITARSMFAGLQFYDRYLLASDIYNGKFDFSLQNMLIEMLGNRFLKTVLDNRKKANRLRKEREDYQSCKNSFDGDTLIATENGLVPIEEIKIGDRVWAYNETNQTKSLQEVTHLIYGEDYKNLVDIKLSSGEVITTTDNHPFWSVDLNSWVIADELNSSTILLDINETNSTITSLKHYKDFRKVFNLSVDRVHTFFVGLNGVLGHNCPGDELPDWLKPKGDEIKDVFNSITDHPEYPKNFKKEKNSFSQNNVNNKGLLKKLRAIKTGKWKKIYEDGYDGDKQISLHYFKHESGIIFGLKSKSGWSNDGY